MSEPPRLLGLGEAAYTSTSFFVVRTRGPRQLKLQLPFDQLGTTGVELVCERGMGAVPLLIDLVNLIASSKGVLALHASAFNRGGVGVLVTGWAKGGKTEALLGFMASGAEHVGDEWVYLPDDHRMYGIPEPMRVWDWHLDDLQGLRRRLPSVGKLRLRALEVAAMAGRVAGAGESSATSLVRRVGATLERQRFVHVLPEELFGSRACVWEGTLDRVVLLVSHDDPATVMHEVAVKDVADRMGASLQFERDRLRKAYEAYRFAFPSAPCELLERVGEREATLLGQRLDGVPAYELRHPYPADIPAMVEAIGALLPNP